MARVVWKLGLRLLGPADTLPKLFEAYGVESREDLLRKAREELETLSIHELVDICEIDLQSVEMGLEEDDG